VFCFAASAARLRRYCDFSASSFLNQQLFRLCKESNCWRSAFWFFPRAIHAERRWHYAIQCGFGVSAAESIDLADAVFINACHIGVIVIVVGNLKPKESTEPFVNVKELTQFMSCAPALSE
jgi:hypothetical protein